MIRILAIEGSCDDTAVAIVNEDREILTHEILSQNHQKYMGVVPEIAARTHLRYLPSLLNRAMSKVQLTYNDLDCIAATAGPGLIGGLLVGTTMAKALASASNKPFLAINHLEAHALTIRFTNRVNFPFLLLLISGGHCQIVIAEELGKYVKLGETLDDAPGEAFDKVAKMLTLGYPGGPIIEKYAQHGKANAFNFPRTFLKQGCDFSFSGLKTAVSRTIQDFNDKLTLQDKYNICASFQNCVSDVLINRIRNALCIFTAKYKSNTIVISGGVSANKYLFTQIRSAFPEFTILSPPLELCTDNAVMIAWTAIERFERGESSSLEFKPRARWELTTLT